MTPARYLRLYRVFARNNLVRELEFRGNFWAKLFTNVGWLVSYLLYIEILFANTDSLGGWNKGEVFLLFGTFVFARAWMDALFTPNMGKIPELVRLGTMDFVLTKPVPSQFYVSARYLSLDELGSLLGSAGIIAYALSLLQRVPTAGQALLWLLLVVCGVAILYALQLLLMTLSFWLVRIDNLSALTDTVVFVGRYPPDIFPRVLNFGLTFVLPLAFIAAVPTKALLGTLGPGMVAAGLAIAAGFLLAAALFWRYATRAYTSASS